MINKLLIAMAILFSNNAWSDTQAVFIPAYGDLHWKAPVAGIGSLPATGNLAGDARVETAGFSIQIWNGSAWVNGSGGAAITSLTGDVTGTGPGATATTVVSVGGSSAANIHTAELLANAATSAATPNTIPKRDANANAAFNSITLNRSSNGTKGGLLVGSASRIDEPIAGQLNAAHNVIFDGSWKYIESDGAVLNSMSTGPSEFDVLILPPGIAGAAATVDPSTTVLHFVAGVMTVGTTTNTVNSTFYGNGTFTSTVAGTNLTSSGDALIDLDLAGTKAMTGTLNMNSHLINNVTNPASAQDAATKSYVDGLVNGLNWKAAVQNATTAALPASTYNNGASGVGATLIEVGLGALSIDGTTPTVGDRELIKNQASSFQNGIYTVTTVGSAGVAYVLTRATDFNQASEISQGDSVFVVNGTVNGDTAWSMISAGPYTMGTTGLTWVQVSGPGSLIAGNGISISGSTISANTDGTTIDTGGAGNSIEIKNGGVTLAKMANETANTILGNNTGSPATPIALSIAQVQSLLSMGTVTSVTMPPEQVVTNSTTAVSVARPLINPTAKTTSYQVLNTDDTINVNCASACNITMPDPTGAGASKIVTIVEQANSGVSNALVTILPFAAETFGETALANLHMQTVGETWQLGSNGTNWKILNHKTFTLPATYTMTVGATTTPPTFGTHTFTTYWWRHGSQACTRFTLSQTTAGTNGSGVYTYSTPFTADSTLLLLSAPTATTVSNTIGNGTSYNSGDAMKSAMIGLQSTTTYYVALSSSQVMSSAGGVNHQWSATTELLSWSNVCFTVANWEP